MKKRKNERFAISHRGYDVNAVESYIALESARTDEMQLELRNRIKALQDECDSLKNRLKELNSREEQIKMAFINATENANKMSQDVKARYECELQRLRLFRAKWLNAYEEMKQRYRFDKDALNMESVAVSVEMELKKFLSKDFSLNDGKNDSEMEEYFRSEVERLTKQQQACQTNSNDEKCVEAITLKGKLQECEQKKKGTKDSGNVAFSIEDAMHPNDSLQDICKALGLGAKL